jgi:hypothetical protein
LLNFLIGSVNGGLELVLVAFQFENDAFVMFLPVIYHILSFVVVYACHLKLHPQPLDVLSVLFDL